MDGGNRSTNTSGALTDRTPKTLRPLRRPHRRMSNAADPVTMTGGLQPRWRVFRGRHLFRSAVILAFALTLAQIGALAHAYSHLQTAAGKLDRVVQHATLCGDCATFGAVLTTNGTANAGAYLAVAPPLHSPNDISTGSVNAAARHYFQAQGPPTLR